MNKFDIRSVKKPCLSGDPNDPSEKHSMRVPRSIRRRMIKIGNKRVVDILDKNLPACSPENTEK